MNYKVIQSMLLPGSNAENHELYYKGSAGVRPEEDGRGLVIPPGEKADFFTYFNGIYMEQWRRYTNVRNIRIKADVQGHGRLSFCHTEKGKGNPVTVIDFVFQWNTGADTETKTFDIVGWDVEETQVCYLEVQGLDEGALLRHFQVEASAEEVQPVCLALVICTYKREQEVRDNLRKLAAMPREACPAVFLVDNGNTLGEERFPEFVRYIPNKNCGGTGGFTRGILEVLKEKGTGFSHVILMDDDIVLETGVLTKTWNLLSYLREEFTDASLAGSLLRRDLPWQQYECGALWNRGKIVAGKHHADLRTREGLIGNLSVENCDYGGWWYCCFPIEQIRKKGLPMPFFVHRDDIEYGMRMGKTITMNGIGVWHEAFERKLPQTGEYYDIRNMAVVNAIYCEDWTKREWKWFLQKWVVGNVLRGRYEYVKLNLYGALDFLKGSRWLGETDAVELHRRVSNSLSPLVPEKDIPDKDKKTAFCTDPGVSVYVAARKRKIIYEDPAGNCLMAEKSLKKALGCFLLLRKTLKKINRNFERARESYHKDYRELTTTVFWNKYLGMEKK